MLSDKLFLIDVYFSRGDEEEADDAFFGELTIGSWPHCRPGEEPLTRLALGLQSAGHSALLHTHLLVPAVDDCVDGGLQSLCDHSWNASLCGVKMAPMRKSFVFANLQSPEKCRGNRR
jgi:hypothetical protein